MKHLLKNGMTSDVAPTGFVRKAAWGLLELGVFVAGVWAVSHLWCAREAGAWMRGDARLQEALAAGVERTVDQRVGLGDFTTGSSQFNGEWLFGTYLMAGFGFGQMAVAHPGRREHFVGCMERCIARLVDPEVRAFDRAMWSEDPLESLDGDAGHGAYLGYLNLLLSFHRLLDGESGYGELNDQITTALGGRVQTSSISLVESYPDEVYPVDNCAVISSIALYDKATGRDHGAVVQKALGALRTRYRDPVTGLLFQAVHPNTGEALDEPRGSGTCLGLYFLSFADPALSRDLYGAVRRELARPFLGFGGIREYPRSIRGGGGDIDSGPIVFGFSLSATGFAIAGARIHGDAQEFSALYSSAYLCGAPYDADGRRTFVTGGPLGNAILFAMLTALPQGVLP
jgi:hypothetical protein